MAETATLSLLDNAAHQFSSASSMQMFRLKSNDDPPVLFTVSRKATHLSTTISMMLENVEGDDQEAVIPLPNVDGDTLDLIVKWIEQHKNDPAPVEIHYADEDDSDDSDSDNDDNEHESEVAIPEWDMQFLPKNDSQKNQLFKLLNASSYLEISPLLDIGCKYIADKISGQKVEWVRDYLNMKNDYTEEEEHKLRQEFDWDDMWYSESMQFSHQAPLTMNTSANGADPFFDEILGDVQRGNGPLIRLDSIVLTNIAKHLQYFRRPSLEPVSHEFAEALRWSYSVSKIILEIKTRRETETHSYESEGEYYDSDEEIFHPRVPANIIIFGNFPERDPSIDEFVENTVTCQGVQILVSEIDFEGMLCSVLSRFKKIRLLKLLDERGATSIFKSPTYSIINSLKTDNCWPHEFNGLNYSQETEIDKDDCHLISLLSPLLKRFYMKCPAPRQQELSNNLWSAVAETNLRKIAYFPLNNLPQVNRNMIACLKTLANKGKPSCFLSDSSSLNSITLRDAFLENQHLQTLFIAYRKVAQYLDCLSREIMHPIVARLTRLKLVCDANSTLSLANEEANLITILSVSKLLYLRVFGEITVYYNGQKLTAPQQYQKVADALKYWLQISIRSSKLIKLRLRFYDNPIISIRRGMEDLRRSDASIFIDLSQTPPIISKNGGRLVLTIYSGTSLDDQHFLTSF